MYCPSGSRQSFYTVFVPAASSTFTSLIKPALSPSGKFNKSCMASRGSGPRERHRPSRSQFPEEGFLLTSPPPRSARAADTAARRRRERAADARAADLLAAATTSRKPAGTPAGLLKKIWPFSGSLSLRSLFSPWSDLFPSNANLNKSHTWQ